MTESRNMNIQDPDYENIIKSPTKRVLSDDLKVEKIISVVNREFSTEIERKEKEIDLVDQRLLLAKKTLHRLRYAIVNSYYNSKQFHLNEEDVRREIVSQKDPVARAKVHTLLKDEQKRLHPALKKLLGEKPDVSLDEVFKVRPPRKRNKAESDAGPSTSENVTIPVDNSMETLRSHIKCEIKTEPIDDNMVMEPSHIKIPRYVQPNDMEKNVIKIDTVIRNKQKEKFRIIIGNTSKYTPPHSEMDRSTHRWLLYIRGPRDKPDVSHFIDTVIVKLDSSYAPHNIIKLSSPPFHLSRRGWGEFAVNLRVHFKNERLNKPVNLIHNLKLDRNYTGLQTLGSETVVDVWLYCDDTMIEKELDNSNCITKHVETDYPNLSIVKCERPDNEEVQIKDLNEIMVHSKDKITSPNKSHVSSPKTSAHFESTTDNLKNSITPQLLSKASSMNQNNVLDVRIFNQRNIQNQKRACISNESILMSSKSSHVSSNHKTKSLVKTHPNSLLKISDSSESENSSDEFKTTQFNDTIPSQHSINVQAFLEDHCYVNESFMLQAFLINSNKYHPTLKLANSISNCTNLPPTHATFSSSTKCPARANYSESRANESLTSLENFFNLNINKMDNIRSAVGLMLKKMPIIHEMAKVEEFQRLFPYAVKTEDEFFKLNFVKRRNLEWTRAKIIKSFISSHWIPSSNQAIKMWSVKQIILFSHYHGYYPVRQTTKCAKSSDVEFSTFSNSKMFNSPFMQEGKINYGFKTVGQINSLTNINEFKKESMDRNIQLCLNSQNHPKDTCYSDENSEDEVDICNVGERNDNEKKCKFIADKCGNKSELIQFADNDEKLMCSYIEKICAKQGVELKSENIDNGFSDCLAHKTILSAVKCLIEDILRRSLALKITSQMEYPECDENTSIAKCRHPLWDSTEHGVPHKVNLRHVYEAITTRPELDLLTNSGLGTLEMEYMEKI